ncbi:hypothetical protein LTR56_012454 [Elasticomyces elasticus]|nr:hypothetical protein LTR22_026020 [Elasticomyces elasticus]KAK3639483.1 hypothetical protein LTR56_012454 [Elasticomyces elasticus]KAK4904075.1 hypothetical protein LTR49_026400 [Elasticomyces elasticus]KAK5752745.1 hypothetical protein LTS12_017217 [Elasticomyces elasticus]
MQSMNFPLKYAARNVRRHLGRPIHLVLDWDGTMTTKDTMAVLGDLPKSTYLRKLHESREGPKPSRNGDQENESGKPTKRQTPLTAHGNESLSKANINRLDGYPGSQWNDLGTAYMKDYHAHKAAHYPKSDPVDHNEYVKWLDSLRPIEYASAQRAMSTSHFRGVRSSDVESHAKDAIETQKVTLREGCITLLLMSVSNCTDYVPPTGSKVSIISVNWSESFIRWALYHAVPEESQFNSDERTNLLKYISNMEIHTNEIDGLDRLEGSSGTLNGHIRTAKEKSHYLPPARKYCQDEQELPLMVYVGDSGTDYECLRNADVGIWLNDCGDGSVKERFRDTFQPLDVTEVTPFHVSEAKVLGQCGEKTWCLWARSLADVGDYLERLGEPQTTA